MVDSLPETRGPVYDFDFYADPILQKDVLGGYLHLKHNAPPLFWTPHNGGHWVVTSTNGVITALRHPEIYSSRFLSIPPSPNQQRMIPESLDPPEHRAYRQMLRPWFESKAIAPLEPRITQWAEKLIDAVAGKGKCAFVEEVGSRFPVSVFMEMFGFPLDELEMFRNLVVEFFKASAREEDRMRMSGQIVGILMALIAERQAEPRDDMISKLVTTDFEGRKLNQEELISIGFLMFLAGLDTVVNALTFGMRHLASDAALRQSVIDNPDSIDDVVEELMRRYTFVSVPRYIVQDTELECVKLKAGESILVPLHMVGWDEKMTHCPEEVRLDRPTCRHAAFGSGIHTCLGIHLARMEMAVFYRTWLTKIGHFRQAEDQMDQYRGGSVQALEELRLSWG